MRANIRHSHENVNMNKSVYARSFVSVSVKLGVVCESVPTRMSRILTQRMSPCQRLLHIGCRILGTLTFSFRVCFRIPRMQNLFELIFLLSRLFSLSGIILGGTWGLKIMMQRFDAKWSWVPELFMDVDFDLTFANQKTEDRIQNLH